MSTKVIRKFLTSPLCKQNSIYNLTSKRNNISESILRSKDFTNATLPENSRVVICGGGLTGCSVAYHLSKIYGWTDIVILEQGRLGGGTTWYGAGLLGAVKNSPTETAICQASIQLYQDLTAQGLDLGWKQCGSLSLARTRGRMMSLRRLAAIANAQNIPCKLLTPPELDSYCPHLHREDLEGGLWVEADGVGDQLATCLALASEAHKLGVAIVENCVVEKVLTDSKSRVSQVLTSKGPVNCDYFVNCSGYSSRHVGQLSSPPVNVPVYPCEQYYLHTHPVEDMNPNMPVIYDFDGHIYIREHQGRYLAGGFEPISKPVDPEQLPSSIQPLPEDWDQFYILLQQILFRMPCMENVEVDRLWCRPKGFTPDCKWIIGEAPEVDRYFVAVGLMSKGLEAAGGVGKLTADWIVNGEVEMDVLHLDIRRFLGLHNNHLFLRDRMREAPGFHYSVHYPFAEFKTGRCLRMSPLYPRLFAKGAYFGQIMGYERPCYFDSQAASRNTNVDIAPRVAETQTFGKPPWLEQVRREYLACRESVALLDYSSYTKLEIWSPGLEVVSFLQYLCSNNVDIPVGQIIHSGMQNLYGGYENDVSLVRLAENKYLLVAPTSQQTRCQVWLHRHLPPGSLVTITDVTSMYTALCVMGPSSIPLLSELTDTDLSPPTFPFFTYKELEVGLASGIRTFHITHTGELGYVLYIPNEYALHIYDLLIERGQKYDLQHAGHYAMRTLRIEKFYAFWGQDLDPTTTPLECGRAFRVKFNKGEFIGKQALLKQQKAGVKRVYIQLILEDHDPDLDSWPWGSEPIYLGDTCVGRTTTTGFGFTLNKQVCLGFVHCVNSAGELQVIPNDDYIIRNKFEVDIAGQRFGAKATLHSPNLPDKVFGNRYQATRKGS